MLEYNRFSKSPVQISKPNGLYHYSIGTVPFFEYDFGTKLTVQLYDQFLNMFTAMRSLMKLTTDFEVSLKFIATYGMSKYAMITGGKYHDTYENELPLMNLTPTLYFKVYGLGAPVEEIQQFIYETLRDMYITDVDIFMSNICTLVEENFDIESIKFMGIDSYDASYQHIRYEKPTLENADQVESYIPEQLSVYPGNIIISLDESYNSSMENNKGGYFYERNLV